MITIFIYTHLKLVQLTQFKTITIVLPDLKSQFFVIITILLVEAIHFLYYTIQNTVGWVPAMLTARHAGFEPSTGALAVCALAMGYLINV